ncbi:hypothetical protein GCM10027592_46840 [Spirosoma flavus]
MASVLLSFLDRKGNLPMISGLNWGQRGKRERNQAYIKVPASVYRSDFFPQITEPFTLTTDDGTVFNCAIAQQYGKAIHTPQNNSLLGVYFRQRLGVPAGELVTLEHLQQYGRTDVRITKVDDSSFLMDFSVH